MGKKRNYTFSMTIRNESLCEEKRPPICDSCNDPMPDLYQCQSCLQLVTHREVHLAIEHRTTFHWPAGSETPQWANTNLDKAFKQVGYTVTALVLNNSIWGLVCEKCRTRYHSKLTYFKSDEVDPLAKEALTFVLSKPMTSWFSCC